MERMDRRAENDVDGNKTVAQLLEEKPSRGGRASQNRKADLKPPTKESPK